MNALKLVWGDTRMIVLVSLSAALYAAILIPFKLFTILPGTTEIRPANAIPMVMSMLFGPAAAWGSAMGNLVGDFFGGLGVGDIFGFIGNFLYGYIPYALWRTLFGDAEPRRDSIVHWMGMLGVFLVAGSACAFIVALGLDVVIGRVPFAILGSLIFINNFVMSALLAPPLFFALQPRVRAWSLHWTQILPAEAVRRPRFAWLGAILITVGSVGGLGAGLGLSTGLYGQRMGFEQWWGALKRVVTLQMKAEPVTAPQPVAATATPTGTAPAATRPSNQPGRPAQAEPATPPPPPAGPAPGSHRLGLGLALLPAVGLILAGMLLL